MSDVQTDKKSIKISAEIYNLASRTAGGYHRSTTGQIEHWIALGRAAEDNPELPIDFIKDILVSKGQSHLLAEPFKPE